ncbi:hypothetical protein B0T10DRAFT_317249 [Thelonectria olida]|uniref:Uncharacterized protein n=1 Tax=Thelonectria olida TaxID=1576542 RepID=A0A9P8W4V3_9HYPO|nr:hypothetical protein B0T10DRAFT_317249 [Thelonectria olida]
MSVAGTKTEVSASNFEIDSEELQLDSKLRIYRLVDGARLGLTALALASGVTILSVAADSIAVYNATHVPDDYLLPLWPSKMDLRPTVALIVCSAIVTVANVLSLVASKTQLVQRRAAVHMIISFLTPAVAFVAAITGMAFFYTVNASTTDDSFQSWTCRWKDVTMTTQPHFGTLCKQSKAGLGLMVFLVPLQVIILGVAGYQTLLQRQLHHASRVPERKTGPSPDMS